MPHCLGPEMEVLLLASICMPLLSRRHQQLSQGLFVFVPRFLRIAVIPVPVYSSLEVWLSERNCLPRPPPTS